MAGSDITKYATELAKWLAAAGAPAAPLVSLTNAAGALAGLADGPPTTQATWNLALAEWNKQRNAFGATLAKALVGPLAAVPGFAELLADVANIGTEGIHGGVDLGPVHLELASSVLVIQPPAFSDNPNPLAAAIGPFQLDQIAAHLSSPFGGGKGLPGGGSLGRVGEGFGGTLELPLGPVQVSAMAVVAIKDGQPSLLAILGASFIPPIQLSFGFSLDRVGGLVGVNRRTNSDALRAAVRTGAGGDVLFAARPPANPMALVVIADQLFPANRGTHLVGPSLKVSWLSFGPEGALMGLDVAVVVEIPTGKVAILGVARVAIPGLPQLINLRLDVLGLIDPAEQLMSIDASLVDSHVLGIFTVYGDAAARFSWGNPGYMVVSIGGFFPGFNPEPARLPAMRRVGLALDNPVPIIEIRSEGYFAVTSNSIQLGGRWEIGISLGIEAHGFLQVDAIVQFRPFHFDAHVAAGFDVSVEGFSFASVTLEGSIAGPGPIVIHGSLSIDVFLFSLSWDETFTLGSGPSDTLPAPPSLLTIITDELNQPHNVESGSIADPLVVLAPRPTASGFAAIPPTGTLRVAQRRAPLGMLIDRADGRPLGGPQGVKITNGTSDVTERFSPGSYITLSNAEALNRPPFDLLAAGRIFSPPDPPLSAGKAPDERKLLQIVIIGGAVREPRQDGLHFDLSRMSAMVMAARKAPALSNVSSLVTANSEIWTATSTAATFASATAAHQHARYYSGVAQAAADAAAPLNLAGV